MAFEVMAERQKAPWASSWAAAIRRSQAATGPKSYQQENLAEFKETCNFVPCQFARGRKPVEGFCDRLGWQIFFASSAEARSAIAGHHEFDAVVIQAEAMDKSVFSTLAAFRRGEKAKAHVPALLIVDDMPQPDYLDQARAAFEHVEFGPILFSTFKLVVRRPSAGKHSAWPALPDTSK